MSSETINRFSSCKERLDALTRDELIEDIRELEEALDTLWSSRQHYIDQVTEAYEVSLNKPLEKQADLVGNTLFLGRISQEAFLARKNYRSKP